MGICVSWVLLLQLSSILAHTYESNRWYQPAARSPAEIITDVINDLGVRILQQYTSHGNVAFSPAGVGFVLAALYEGSAGRGSQQIASALGLPRDRDITRIGFRDIHRRLRTYLNADGFLGGLSLNKENTKLRPEYEDILRFYGFDLSIAGHETNETTPTEEAPVTVIIEDTTVITDQPVIDESPTSSTAASDESTMPGVDETSGTQESQTESSTIPSVELLETTPSSETPSSRLTQSTSTMRVSTIESTPDTNTPTVTPDMIPASSTESIVSSTVAAITTSAAEFATTTVVPEETGTTVSDTQSTTGSATTALNERVTESTPAATTDAITSDSSTTIASTNAVTESDENGSSTALVTEAGTIRSTEGSTTVVTDDNGKDVTTTETATVQPSETSTNTVLMDDRSGESTTADSSTMNDDSTTAETTVSTGSVINDGTTVISITTDGITSVSDTTMTETEITAERSEGTTLSSARDDSMDQIRKRNSRSPRGYFSSYPDEGIWMQDLGIWKPYSPGTNEAYVRDATEISFLVNGCDISSVSATRYITVLPFAYFPSIHAIALEFPLDDPRYNILLLMPTDRSDTHRLARDLGGKSLRLLRKQLQPTWVRATIPSFMLRGFVTLTSFLQRLGIIDVFEPRVADLSPMTPDLGVYARDVQQSIGVNIRNYMKPDRTHSRNGLFERAGPVPFTALHPFLYFIIDAQTSVTLITGRVDDPLNSRIL